MTFIPSSYQSAVFSWFADSADNAAVNAVAGSGKTTTLVKGLFEISESLRRETLFAAFNKSIVEELKLRLPQGIDAQTIHAIGYRAIRKAISQPRWNIDGNKYKTLARRLDVPREFGDRREFVDTVCSLLHYTQATLTDYTDTPELESLAYRFGMSVPDCGIAPIAEGVSVLLEEGLRLAKEEGHLAFGDMLWIPAFLEMPAEKYSLVCVDEAQDLSAAQMWLVANSLESGGRMVAVGDPNQAVYGFAGTENDSFHQIVRKFGASELPLSICYRCPSSVIEEAKKIVPQIECAEGAIPGIVETIKAAKAATMYQPGDMILCRTTAPLIKLCFSLISARKPATIKGKDIGASMISVIKQVVHKRGGFANFPMALDEYEMHQIGILESKNASDAQIESVSDRCEAIRVCFSSYAPRTAESFIREIESLFSDTTSKGQIVLSTVHRSKGLENERIFIIYPEKLPLIWKRQTGAQYQQEMNLKYVAITRAQRELYYVETEKES